jgi:hypothetical protein
MTYLNDPNTHRLATDCCLCGRALRDATSVEIGIGPICRDRAGYGDGPSEHRAVVNQIIHRAGVAAEDGKVTDVLTAASEIDALGFAKVALTIRHRFIPLKVWHDYAAPVTRYDAQAREEVPVMSPDGTPQTRHAICVKTPYSQKANDTRRDFMRGRCRPVKKGRGDFHWEFDANQQRALLGWLAKNWPGTEAFALADEMRGTGAKVFTVPTWEDFTAKNESTRHGWQRKAGGAK